MYSSSSHLGGNRSDSSETLKDEENNGNYNEAHRMEPQGEERKNTCSALPDVSSDIFQTLQYRDHSDEPSPHVNAYDQQLLEKDVSQDPGKFNFMARGNGVYSENLHLETHYIRPDVTNCSSSLLNANNIDYNKIKSFSDSKNKSLSPNLTRKLRKFNITDISDKSSSASNMNHSRILHHLSNETNITSALINEMSINKMKSEVDSESVRDELSESSPLNFSKISETPKTFSNTYNISAPDALLKIKRSDSLDLIKADIPCEKNVTLAPSSQQYFKTLLSKSQPNLLGKESHRKLSKGSPLNVRSLNVCENEGSCSAFAELVEILTRENKALKHELDIYYKKVSKLMRFEMEISKVEEQYETLVKLCERREQLERLARHKLQTEIKKLYDQNKDLKDQVESLSVQPSALEANSSDKVSLQKELNKRDLVISQLVSQNKELIACKERQDMELTAQRQTLNEQRTHIDILDSALTTAQTNIVKLEEEVCKKHNLEEQLEQMKRLLISLKVAAEQREQSEKSLRQKLEMEILQLRSSSKLDYSLNESSELKRELREKDERIMLLEGKLTRLEQRLLQESSVHLLSNEPILLNKEKTGSSYCEVPSKGSVSPINISSLMPRRDEDLGEIIL